MKFEVVKGGEKFMSTEHWECVYNDDILADMKKAGYSFKLDGKAATVATISAARKAAEKKK